MSCEEHAPLVGGGPSCKCNANQGIRFRVYTDGGISERPRSKGLGVKIWGLGLRAFGKSFESWGLGLAHSAKVAEGKHQRP